MKKPVRIIIENNDYQLDLEDVSSIQAMPWPARKQLIDVLEAIQQADHIKSAEPKKEISPEPQRYTQKVQTEKGASSVLDPEIKKSDADIDAMMERFILEGRQDRKPIPDKSSIYKYLLIFMAVLLGISILF